MKELKYKKDIKQYLINEGNSLPMYNFNNNTYQKLFLNVPIIYRGKLYCPICKKQIEDGQTTCPHCKAKLHLSHYYSSRYSYESMLRVITSHNGYMVARYFLILAYVDKYSTTYHNYGEVKQIWLINNQFYMIKRKQSGFNYFCAPKYTSETKMNFNEKIYEENIADTIFINKDERIDKNPSGNLKDITKQFFYPMFETIRKIDPKLYDEMTERDIIYLNQIRICLKHGYKITNFQMWKDHINLLNNEKKDINNPFYICPENLEKTHQELIDKINKRQEKIKMEKELLENMRRKNIYESHTKKYSDKYLENDKYVIYQIQTYRQLVEEGKTMHNCVASYYGTNNIILTIRKKDFSHFATCEITPRGRVVQLYTFCNKYISNGNEIKNFIEQNYKTFLKTKRTCKKQAA